MHDALQSYELPVADEPEETSMPAIGRTPSTELVMHVLLLGERHRRMTDSDETSCAVPFLVMHTPTRPERLTHTEGKLCRFCFTPHEVARATANDRATTEREEREWEEQHRKTEEFFASLRSKKPTQPGDK